MVAVDDIKPFIDCLENYFIKRSFNELAIETPYLTDSVNSVLSDYTGIIAITGEYSGNVYFTASRSFLERLITAHGQSDFSEKLTRDMVGEITNTLSGNSRKKLGSRFEISVPDVIEGDIDEDVITHGVHSYVVPITLAKEKAVMIVSVMKI